MSSSQGSGPKFHKVIPYLTFIGLLIAYQLNKDYKDPETSWHIKNMFGLLLGLFAAVWLQNYPLGTTKLQMLLGKAKKRSIYRIFLPGGQKFNELKEDWEWNKLKWEDMNVED